MPFYIIIYRGAAHILSRRKHSYEGASQDLWREKWIGFVCGGEGGGGGGGRRETQLRDRRVVCFQMFDTFD